MINDIKSKIPFGKKGKQIDEDEDEEIEDESTDATDPSITALDKTGETDIDNLDDDEDEPQSIVDKIKAKLSGKKKSTVSDDTEIGDKKKNKKKMNPIVLIVVLGALGVFLFYEEEPTAPPPELKKVERVSRKKKNENKPLDTETPAPADKATVAETPAAPADEATVAETPAAPVDEATVAETPAAPVDEATVVETPDTSDETPIDEPVVTDVPTDTSPTSFDSVDGQVTESDESTMTDKILEDLEKQVKKDQPTIISKEYVSPPDYEYRGRGLVYNCAGKHWACVDGPSYKVCESNFSSTTYQKKTIECYPFNIYETKKGCELMQNRVVSSSAKTDFCKGN